jgi:PBP1b-binding outer membrane lipoprotein LpoB
MLSRMMSVVLCIVLLTACVQNKNKMAESQSESGINKPLSEKCQSAKQDFDKAVQAGERDNLHELKRNIELYCVWRRY